MYQFEDFQNKPLVERVEDNILSYIVDNKIQIGEKIPNEFELAKQFGVGRSTIREAIKILASKNILEVRRGCGTFVKSNRKTSDDPLGIGFVTERLKLATDFISVRLMLEPEIAAMAAVNATDEDIEALVAQCEKVEKLIIEGGEYIDEDIKLHGCIARCTQNIVVENLIPIINSSIAIFANVTHRKLRKETVRIHRIIVEAIQNRRPEEAKNAMTMHLLYNWNEIQRIKAEEEK